MKCALTGVAAFVVCAIVVSLFLPSVRSGGAAEPKKLPVRVRVIDSENNSPISGARVILIRSWEQNLAQAVPPSNPDPAVATATAETDAQGYAEVLGTFRAVDNRRGDPIQRHKRWYFLGGDWLKVVADGRPTAYVWLNGHNFGGERDYDNNEPLEVIAVMNQGASGQ